MQFSPEQVEGPQEKPEIIGKGAEKAMEALLIRDELLFGEANRLGIDGIKTAELTHEHPVDCCNFISGQFPKLPELNFLG